MGKKTKPRQKSDRNSAIKQAKIKKHEESLEGQHVDASDIDFDEQSIKDRIVNMLDDFKQQGGVLELGEKDSGDEQASSSDGDHEINEDKVDSDTDEKKTPSEERKKQREKKKFDYEKNTRTVFVGNLPASYDHRDVAKLFKDCGPVESARIRSVVPDKEKLAPKVAQITKRIHPKIDSVNAYVVFVHNNDDQPIKKALMLNGKLIDGHHIRVDRAIMPNAKRMTLTSRKKSIFVGNLRFDIRDDDLINYFTKVGSVNYVRIVRDRSTGLGKGFGFVVFNERSSVKEALKLDDSTFKGRQIRVKKVQDDEKPSKGGKSVTSKDEPVKTSPPKADDSKQPKKILKKTRPVNDNTAKKSVSFKNVKAQQNVKKFNGPKVKTNLKSKKKIMKKKFSTARK